VGGDFGVEDGVVGLWELLGKWRRKRGARDVRAFLRVGSWFDPREEEVLMVGSSSVEAASWKFDALNLGLP